MVEVPNLQLCKPGTHKMIDMKKDIKEKLMIISALTTLASGIALSFLSFFLSSYHIDNSVLWYFAQTLMYAGSCFGIGAYITKFKNEVNEKINENNKP